jgi:hypothetical protein
MSTDVGIFPDTGIFPDSSEPPSGFFRHLPQISRHLPHARGLWRMTVRMAGGQART